jgi:MraZ protein
VQVTHLFSGNALGAVDGDGRVRLPAFILREMERHCDRGRIFLGVHESDPCLTGYAPGERPRLHAELERRRLREESAGADSGAHHTRARRLFGLAEEARYDADGAIALPPLARRRAAIGRHILFVGAGTHFEIWDAERALADGDEALRELAEARLGIIDTQEEEEETR